MFAFGFTALFFFTSIAGMRAVQRVSIPDLLTALGSGGFLLMWVLGAAADEWRSMLLIAWTIVFAFGASLAVRMGAHTNYFYSYAGVGVVFIGMATVLELEGPTLAIATIIEALVVLLVGYRITRNVRTIPILAIPAIVPLLLALESAGSRAWHNSIVHGDSLVLLLTVGALIGVAKYFRYLRLNEPEEIRTSLVTYANVAGIGAALYGVIYIWLASNALFDDVFGITVSMFIYTAVGAWLYLWGKRTGQKWKRVVGGIMVVVSASFLLFVFGGILGPFGRIIAYMLVGVLLVFTAWRERDMFSKKDDTQQQKNVPQQFESDNTLHHD